MATHHDSRQSDLTARARIRNAALELYATRGEERVSMRAVAAEAGVTIGLIQHHFGTKAGLGQAVDDYVVDHFVGALATVEETGSAQDVISARDDAVRVMLRESPLVVQYLNRSMIEPTHRGAHLLGALVDLMAREIEGLRRSGYASTSTSRKVQVVRMLMDQVGQLFLEPMVDAVWEHLEGEPDNRPTARVTVTGS